MKPDNSLPPLVSFIIPSYNAARYLRSSILSCLNQTYPNIEIILVDDGSTDNTFNIAQEFINHKNFQYEKNEKNQGLIYSLNKGINLAKGEFIARMDADDLSLPTRIQSQVNFLLNNPEVEVVGSDVILIDLHDTKMGLPRELLQSEAEIEWSIITSCPLHHPTVMFKKRFQYRQEEKLVEDLGLWARVLLENKKIVVLNTPLLLYRKHPNSITANNAISQINASIPISTNFAKIKWDIELSRNFLYSVRTRSQFQNNDFFKEALAIIRKLELNNHKSIASAAAVNIQVACLSYLFSCLISIKKLNLKAIFNILTFTLSPHNFKYAPSAFFKFTRGIYRRLIIKNDWIERIQYFTKITPAQNYQVISPLVSIIIPIYNAGSFLKAALDSCINQTYKNIEIIVIDDGSTDNSAAVCKNYMHYPNFKYIRNEKNQGLIYSLNKAASLATGEYIARMDQDDICFPNRIELQLDYLKKNPDVCALGTDVILMDKQNYLFGKPRQILFDESSIEWSLISSCPLHHPTVMFNKKLLIESFNLNELYDKDLHFAEDLGLWSRLLLANKKIHVLNKPLLFYRKHSTSMSTVYKAPQLQASINISRNFAEKKWKVQIDDLFLKSIRTRNGLDNKLFFIEATKLIRHLRNNYSQEVARTALIDLQCLCFECLHFLPLKRESNRINASINALSFLIQNLNIITTSRALLRFYKGLIRRFIFLNSSND